MTDENDRRDGHADSDPTPAELLDELEPFEPYTTEELADAFDTEPGVIRRLLARLVRTEAVRKKTPTAGPDLWIRDPPVNTFSACGREFAVTFAHPVFSATNYCPRCGNRL